jgi:hypothetical protein
MARQLPLLESNDECVYGQLYFIQEVTGYAGGTGKSGLVENVDRRPGRPTIFEGKFQEADCVNKNNRRYGRSILEPEITRLSAIAGERGLYGELDHPDDAIIHMADASHLNIKFWWEGNKVMGRGEILPTPAGQVLEACFRAGAKVGISSRGVGTGKVNDRDGVLDISEQYKCITFDDVADPSTPEAYQAIAEAASLDVQASRAVYAIAEALDQGDFERARALAKNCTSQSSKTKASTIDRLGTLREDKLAEASHVLTDLIKRMVLEKR